MRVALRAILAVVMLVGFAAAPALAQEGDAKPAPKKRKIQTMDPRTGKRFESVTQLFDVEDYAGAEQSLEGMLGMRGLNSYEEALIWQYLGYARSSLEKFPQATEAFRKAIALEALPIPSEQAIQYTLAQLYMAQERWDEGIAALTRWISEVQNPSPSAFYLLGTAYVQKGDFKSALPWAKKAVTSKKVPKQGWLQVLMACHFELGQYRELAGVLQQLILHYPKKAYWLQLSAVYSELGEDKNALATLELAYREGLLDRDKELIQMAQLYLYHEVPFKAAQVLEKGLADGILEEDAKTMRLLAESWMYARSYDKALAPMAKAATLDEDGDLYVQLAQLYLEREEWEEASTALIKAIEKGDLTNPGNAQLLAGVAQYNAGQNGAARRSFQRARKFKKSQKSAAQWLRHLEREAQRS